MAPSYLEKMKAGIPIQVRQALEEDLAENGTFQDITSQALGTASDHSRGKVITREPATICGVDWVNQTFSSVDDRTSLQWQVKDGDEVVPDQTLFTFEGPSLGLLSAERCALNFLQTLSGTATRAKHFTKLIGHLDTALLDTRKTIPGLRLAQKYAVHCGGGQNHRLGLYDAFLIKENHIAACGGIVEAVTLARKFKPNVKLEIEVENLKEFELAASAGPDVIMLDNFSLEDMCAAVAKNYAPKLEASGNVNEHTIVGIAQTGVDFVSLGTLTKDVRAVDLSMRFD